MIIESTKMETKKLKKPSTKEEFDHLDHLSRATIEMFKQYGYDKDVIQRWRRGQPETGDIITCPICRADDLVYNLRWKQLKCRCCQWIIPKRFWVVNRISQPLKLCFKKLL